SSESESDGDGAMRDVLEREAESRSRRGPANQTRQHWHDPIAVAEPGKHGTRWQFKCKYCPTSVFLLHTQIYAHISHSVNTVPRTPGCKSFDEEKPQPALGNLATHMKKKHSDKLNETGATPTTAPPTKVLDLITNKVMGKFVEDGRLNPKIEPTQRGFTRLTTAWVVQEDQPFTAPEAPLLSMMFEYAGGRFTLPSDTTIRATCSQKLSLRLLPDHFIALTMDNASANDVMAETTGQLLGQRYNIGFHPENGRVRCVAHVVNLVAQKFLSVLSEAKDPDDEDYYTANKHLPTHYDVNTDPDVLAMENEDADGGSEEDADADEELTTEVHGTNVSPLKKVSHRTLS
ncbi:hypothetical protein SCHPADRAFT_984499, partial [Schizopora paradoxa]